MFMWTRGFNACLWAAIIAHTLEQTKGACKYSTKRRLTQLFFVMRIAQAIAWIRMLPACVIRDRDGKAFTFQKWTSAATWSAELIRCVRADASPFGMGAIVFKYGVPVAWIAEE